MLLCAKVLLNIKASAPGDAPCSAALPAATLARQNAAVCSTTAPEDYFPGVCLSVRNTLARRKTVIVLLSDVQ